MRPTLGLAAIALAALVFAVPTAQAGPLALDGLSQQESLAQTIAAKKKKVMKKKKKKKVYAKKAKAKKKALKRTKKRAVKKN